MSKSLFKKIFFTLSILFLSVSAVSAKTLSDFSFSNNTTIRYTTGNDYASVTTEYVREVNNDEYYYPASGEKVFFIPDLSTSTEEEVVKERQFKMKSISVTDKSGKRLSFSAEEQEDGIYVSVSNYKSTTYGSPMTMIFRYNTHDLITKIFDSVRIIAPALPEDVEFSSEDSATGTESEYSYSLDIVVDKNIPRFIRAFPSKYSVNDSSDDVTIYSFDQEDRIGNSPVLEFGTSLIYKFEYTYITPKTDDLIDPNISKYFSALSTNIYELSLPREYSETSQRVYIESISPSPSKISMDEEGNIIGTFEVPANEESEILVVGYISVSRSPLKDNIIFKDIGLNSYFEKISEDSSMEKYLTATTYWEVDDEYIQTEAENITGESGIYTILELIEADYDYVNERLEYDQSKADTANIRIGAKAALQGGASVCMEYSDAMITILRAQGIPARAAVGYADLTDDIESSTDILRHQWVQVWIPDYGWLTIDPTYEGKDKIIGAYIDRILWETFSGDSLSNIKVYSADVEKIVVDPEYSVSVYAVESLPEDSLYEYIDFNTNQKIETLEDDNSVLQWLNTFLKTTVIGKALIIVMPIAGVVVVLSILLGTVSHLLKKRKLRNTKTKDQQVP